MQRLRLYISKIRWTFVIVAAMIAVPSVILGILLQNRYDIRFRLTALMSGVRYADILHDRATVHRLTYSKTLEEHRCPNMQGTAIILVVGQSNAANYVTSRHRASAAVYSFFDGKCFRGFDPLPGATGDGGSVWSRMGDALVSEKRFQKVVIVPAAVADTTMEMWAPGGVLFPLVQHQLSSLAAVGLKPTHIVVQQGESDGNTSDPATYQARANALITFLKDGANVPTFFAITSGCGILRNEKLRRAQLAVVRLTNSHVGVDMDRVTKEYRANICHLNEEGAQKVAHEWALLLR
jgi:hypothetical protein